MTTTILDLARSLIARYVVATDEQLDALALYAAYTHAASVFWYAPRLLLQSATPRCGKSTAKDCVAWLSRDPFGGVGDTPAFIYRHLGEFNPDEQRPPVKTIVLDETDNIASELKTVFTALANAGFERSGSRGVMETRGKTLVPVRYRAFSPMILAGIDTGVLSDATLDRSVIINLRKADIVPARFRRGSQVVRDEFARARDEMAFRVTAVADLAGDAVSSGAVSVPRELNPRQVDIWEPMIALADLISREWGQRARRAAVTLSAQVGSRIERDILTDTHEIWSRLQAEYKIASVASSPESKARNFKEARLAEQQAQSALLLLEFIPSNLLVMKLQSLDWDDWRKYYGGAPIDERGVARELSKHSIRPRQSYRNGQRSRGYDWSLFRDPWLRNGVDCTDKDEVADSRTGALLTYRKPTRAA